MSIYNIDDLKKWIDETKNCLDCNKNKVCEYAKNINNYFSDLPSKDQKELTIIRLNIIAKIIANLCKEYEFLGKKAKENDKYYRDA